MGKYQAYPEYKDSGVEWLGEIPKDWKLVSLRFLIESIKNGSTATQVEYAENTYPISRIESISTGEINMDKIGFVKKNDISDSYKILLGELLLSHINSLSMVGNVARKKDNCSLYHGMNLLRITPLKNTTDSCYLYWLLKSKYCRQTIESIAKPAINQASVSIESLKAIQLNIPKINEQVQIASFLNHKTAKIDNLIEKQQQLIELLKEKRQAVISHAVTKGLNPDVPMKDSGVEWLEEVPEHWVVCKLKHIANLQSGIPKGKDLTGKKYISIPMLRVANVQDGYLNLNDVHLMQIEPEQLERYLLKDGDVLMNEGGDNDKLGRGAIWEGQISNCIHQNHVFAIRPYAIEPKWLDMLTRANYAKFHFYRTAKQSTNLASISSTNIKETPLTIPPQLERTEILIYLESQIDKLSRIETNCNTQIELLQERRTALISAAVTGKIDVRNWVAPAKHNTANTESQEQTA